MSHKDDYFDGDTHDLLLYKIAQRDKVIELCKAALTFDGFEPEDNHHRIYHHMALAALEQLKGKEKS